MTDPRSLLLDETTSDATPAPPPARRPRSTLRRRLSMAALTLAVAVSAVGYWGLDRYVIDHVAISDVAAYEAAVAPAPAATFGSQSPPTTTAPVVTATTYTNGATSIEVSTVAEGTGSNKVTYYVADVTVGDASVVRGGFAENKFGRNIVADTSDIAASYNAVFAVNGDYYGFRTDGILIRNGVLYRDSGARTGLALYRNGTMAVYDERSTTGAELLAAGVWNTLSFGPGLVIDGEIVKGIDQGEIDNNFGLRSIQGNNPRTGIGLIDANHFVFVVVDGRSSGYSRGVTMTEFAQIFKDLGATVAYNLDGGGSSTMYFHGELVNNPQGRRDERAISDILYVA